MAGAADGKDCGPVVPTVFTQLSKEARIVEFTNDRQTAMT